MKLDKYTSVKKTWFEKKTLEQQIDFVKNLAHVKALRSNLKENKIKEMLQNVNHFKKPKRKTKSSNIKQAKDKSTSNNIEG